MDKYTVVVKQKKTLFGWRRDHLIEPRFTTNYETACSVCNAFNGNIFGTYQGKHRFIIISIDKV